VFVKQIFLSLAKQISKLFDALSVMRFFFNFLLKDLGVFSLFFD